MKIKSWGGEINTSMESHSLSSHCKVSHKKRENQSKFTQELIMQSTSTRGNWMIDAFINAQLHKLPSSPTLTHTSLKARWKGEFNLCSIFYFQFFFNLMLLTINGSTSDVCEHFFTCKPMRLKSIMCM